MDELCSVLRKMQRKRAMCKNLEDPAQNPACKHIQEKACMKEGARSSLYLYVELHEFFEFNSP